MAFVKVSIDFSKNIITDSKCFIDSKTIVKYKYVAYAWLNLWFM